MKKGNAKSTITAVQMKEDNTESSNTGLIDAGEQHRVFNHWVNRWRTIHSSVFLGWIEIQKTFFFNIHNSCEGYLHHSAHTPVS